ncbi:MAG TPA: hypothetical protein VGH23_08410 [Rhizomicrobium sp.]|jgi:hypothetical protein
MNPQPGSPAADCDSRRFASAAVSPAFVRDVFEVTPARTALV